jgi:MFS transporter, MHS family, shikimate and dehydroshikimate transport protein
LNTEVAVLIWLAIGVALWLGHDPMYGSQAAYFFELFGTRLRYSRAFIDYQLASIVGGRDLAAHRGLTAGLGGGNFWPIAV